MIIWSDGNIQKTAAFWILSKSFCVTSLPAALNKPQIAWRPNGEINIACVLHPGFDSRALLTIFLRELGLERGPLSLVIG
jgi:hypothetical protein